MKWLIGVACVAIIASSGVYLTGQYQARQERMAADSAVATKLALQAVSVYNKQKADADEKAQYEDDEKHITAEDCAVYAHKIISAKKDQKEPDAISMRRIGMCDSAHVIRPDDLRDLRHFAVIGYTG